MIANLIGGFIAILIGASLIGPLSVEVNNTSQSLNSTGHCVASYPLNTSCELSISSGWGATVLKLVPGFFALGILGIGIAVTYSSLRQAGVV